MESDASRRFRLVVFDLDGTLIDSRRDIAESANALLVECGAAPLEEAALGRMVGDGAATLVARAFHAAGFPLPDDALARFLDIYDRRLLRHTRPYDGVEPLLHTLAAGTSLAVLTNKPLAATRAILEGLRLAPFFQGRVLGGDGPLPRKPDPAGLEQLMSSAYATPQRTMMVGDSMVDQRTARAAGTACCLARYGFGFHTVDVNQLTDRDFVIDSPLELMARL